MVTIARTFHRDESGWPAAACVAVMSATSRSQPCRRALRLGRNRPPRPPTVDLRQAVAALYPRELLTTDIRGHVVGAHLAATRIHQRDGVCGGVDAHDHPVGDRIGKPGTHRALVG